MRKMQAADWLKLTFIHNVGFRSLLETMCCGFLLVKGDFSLIFSILILHPDNVFY